MMNFHTYYRKSNQAPMLLQNICSYPEETLLHWNKFNIQKPSTPIGSFEYRQVSRLTPMMFILIFTLILFTPLMAIAADLPDAGSILEETNKSAILPLKEKTPIKIEQQDPPTQVALKSGTKVLVRGFRITENTVFTKNELMKNISSYIGQELSFVDLHKAVDKISSYYQSKGYILSRAYLPAQDITDGIVTISIIEGRVRNVEVIRGGNARMDEDTVKWLMSGSIKEGDVITENRLERGTLLINDLPSLQLQSILKPGDTVGTSDLILDLKEEKALQSTFEGDNFGNRYTGYYRSGFTLKTNNPAGFGESYSIRALASKGLTYGSLSLSLPAGKWGTILNSGYSIMTYKLGKDFEDLEAKGSARTMTLNVLHPFARHSGFNLYGHLQYESKTLKDRVELFSSRSEKKVNSFMLACFLEEADSLLGGGSSSVTLNGHSGSIDIRDVETKTVDHTTARSNGSYRKMNVTATRIQHVRDRLVFYTSLTGQTASKNLDSSEKLSLGGPNGVRSYPQGEANGDSGYIITGEIRYLLPEVMPLPGDIQTIAFIDNGSIKINHDPWPGAISDNTVNLSGIGIGLNWAWKNWMFKTNYAKKIGSEHSTLDADHSGCFWLNAVASF
jgi:hemolysin activation/secretion protein